MPARSLRVGDRGQGGMRANVMFGELALFRAGDHQVTIPVKRRQCIVCRARRRNRRESGQDSAGRCSTRKQLVASPADPKIMHMTSI